MRKTLTNFCNKAYLKYLAVTLAYFVSAFAVNRIAHFVEGRVQVPGMIGGK